MRLSSRVWLLLCGGLSGLGCLGGPISDWPRGSSNSDKDTDDTKSEADDDDDSASPADENASGADDSDSEEPPRSTGKDAGAKSPSGAKADAGIGAQIDAGAQGTSGSASPSTDASGDGGVDAGVDSLSGPSCTMTSDGREAGGCYGSYCNTSQGSMLKRAEQSGACSSADELSLACDGEISRVVAECAEHDVVALGVGRSVAACARRAASLAKVGAPCLDCYVDEIVCSLRNCLVACLDGSSMACSECRESKCQTKFLECSGLPAPAGASSPGPVGVDGGLRRL